MEKTTNVSVIGAGSWGTTICNIIASNVPNVRIWAKEPNVVASINSKNINEQFLPGITLNKNITATDNAQDAFASSKIIIWAIPVQYTRPRLKECAQWVQPGSIIINLSKGIEEGSSYQPAQIFAQECHKLRAYGSLGGPNIASEIAKGMASVATLAITNHWEIQGIEKIFCTDKFRVDICPDLIALELAGALKNVVAIAAGICDGCSIGDNMRSTIIARGFEEMRTLGRSLGANPESFVSSFALGDLLTTCTSKSSRNRTLGENLGRGLSLDKALAALNGRVAEGISTARASLKLAEKLSLRLPVFETVSSAIAGNITPANFIENINKST